LLLLVPGVPWTTDTTNTAKKLPKLSGRLTVPLATWTAQGGCNSFMPKRRQTKQEAFDQAVADKALGKTNPSRRIKAASVGGLFPAGHQGLKSAVPKFEIESPIRPTETGTPALISVWEKWKAERMDRATLRRRFNQTQSLEMRLSEEAKRLREEAKLLRPGALRDELIRKAEQAETGAHISEWLRSPGLRPPQ
jgi:hypothetical protein